ncbi:ParA family protein [Leptolyngbya sp. AN02str]|uniref:ParA family protein n=1 Tax=Leptolyngbya sp. AN02str TaxID=3423363 RepID=UPI003D31FD8C
MSGRSHAHRCNIHLKGGTGKSTAAINLGAALAGKRRVLLIDLDGQRTLSFGLGLDGAEPTALDWLNNETIAPVQTAVKNLDLIPGDIGMFRLTANVDIFAPSLKRIRSLEYDLVLMDCPPSLGVASVQAILNSDRVLMPTLCEPASLKGLSDALSLIRGENDRIPVDVLRCRYRRQLVLTREADDLLVEGATDLGYSLLYATIPENISVSEAIAQQQPVSEYAPNSTGARAYKSLAKEVAKSWGCHEQ